MTGKERATKLKPCPFCGGEAKTEKLGKPYFDKYAWYILVNHSRECAIAGFGPRGYLTKKYAREAWDRRRE